MTGECGSTTLSIPIFVGVPDRPILLNENGAEVTSVLACTYVHKSLCPSVDAGWNVLEWEWEKVTGDFNLIDFESCADILGYQPGFGFISVRVRNECGWSNPTFISVNVTDCNSMTMQQKSIKMYPNPATSSVTLSVDNEKDAQSTGTGNEVVTPATINEVKVYDNFGKIKLYRKYTKQQTAKLDISGLTKGIYLVEINTGSRIEHQQLMIIK